MRKTLRDIIGEKAESLNSFVDSSVNVVELRGQALGRQLLEKWNSAGNGRFTIAHFGDSLVQPGVGAQIARNKLQALAGSAGRGMAFPYAMAKTYSQEDFASTSEGNWLTANSIQSSPVVPLGVSGFAARNFDRTSSFTFHFVSQLEPGRKRVRIFYAASGAPYRLRLTSAGQQWTMNLPVKGGTTTQVADIEVAKLGDVIAFEIQNTSTHEGIFEIHGVSIENMTPGVMYHNLGVGGANFGALLGQTYSDEQMPWLAPDLVILDWGTNDVIYKNAVARDLESVIASTIQKVRAVNPNALVMLTTVQDMLFRQRPITAAWDFAILIRRIALEHNCLLYDWYRVAGGRNAMRTWYAYNLCGPDHLHLSTYGYAIKGELLAQALLNSLDILRRTPLLENISVNTTRDQHSRSVSAWLKTHEPLPLRAGTVSAKPPTRNPPAAR